MFEVSTASREGLRELTFALWNMVDAYQAAQPEVVPRRPVIRPIPVDQTGFTVEPDPENRGGFVVRGVRPERWIAQTNFDNDEAVGYLGDRLARLGGVEDQLLKLGAKPGCAVTIGDMTFDWEPQTPGRCGCHPRQGVAPTLGWNRTTGSGGRAQGGPPPPSRARGRAVSQYRDALRSARSVVVKIGTTALTRNRGGCSTPAGWPGWSTPSRRG